MLQRWWTEFQQEQERGCIKPQHRKPSIKDVQTWCHLISSQKRIRPDNIWIAERCVPIRLGFLGWTCLTERQSLVGARNWVLNSTFLMWLKNLCDSFNLWKNHRKFRSQADSSNWNVRGTHPRNDDAIQKLGSFLWQMWSTEQNVSTHILNPHTS